MNKINSKIKELENKLEKLSNQFLLMEKSRIMKPLTLLAEYNEMITELKALEFAKKEFLDMLDKKDWLVYSNGRSTDYIDELDIEESLKKLKSSLEAKK